MECSKLLQQAPCVASRSDMTCAVSVENGHQLCKSGVYQKARSCEEVQRIIIASCDVMQSHKAIAIAWL